MKVNTTFREEKLDELYIFDFDKMKEFTLYFKHNNISIVMKHEKKRSMKLRQPKVKIIMGK